MPAAGKKTVMDVDVGSIRALVRVDFNVPMVPGTDQISDDSRIRSALPTIEYLRGQGARVVLCSHFGRPHGEVVEELRLAPVRSRLSELLGVDVADARGPAGRVPALVAAELGPGEVALLENLRFNRREETNDPGFARKLAALGDLFVNDAFGAAHRAHASTVGVAACLPAVAGLLMARELEMLAACLEAPARPVVAVIGGAKVSDKIAVLTNLAERVDTILVGGGMVTAFLVASGHIKRGAADPADVAAARGLLEGASARVVTPSDVVTAERFDADATPVTVIASEAPAGAFVLDIGPDTAGDYAGHIASARTVIWNGPMGVFEWQPFAAGTTAVARAIADNEDCVSVVGGGSTAEAVGALGLSDRITHVSTGGGAALEYLEGKVLPGVAALMDE